jgi:6-phosphofructokinase 2
MLKLAKLVGVEHLEMEEVNRAAKEIISKGGAKMVVSGTKVRIVTKDSYDYVPAPMLLKKSTVGAGDSMVGGMVWALAQNKPLKEVLRWGSLWISGNDE